MCTKLHEMVCVARGGCLGPLPLALARSLWRCGRVGASLRLPRRAGLITSTADWAQFGVNLIHTIISNFVAHYHTERNHQGLANRLISPETGYLTNSGLVQRRQRLGGMLNYYYRSAA